MAKNIIFCADGTWNGPDKTTGQSALDSDDSAGEISDTAVTNVIKLFSNIAGQPTPGTSALKNEQEKLYADAGGNVVQTAKYLHGVGDSSNLVTKALGGVLGVGVISRIIRGYTFISRAYQPGDAIFINGFSRGAYTARALAGMITKIGLLDSRTYDATNKEDAYRLAAAAWAKSKTLSLQGHGLFNAIAGYIIDFIQNVIALPLQPNSLIADVPLKAVAVWDTVGSLGIPTYVNDRRYDLFRFVDQDLSAKVERGFHAMAIDELRADFPVTRWTPRAGIEETWFVGAHADVGGGYPEKESRLSDEALGWMIARLGSVGVRFANPLPAQPQPQTLQQDIHTPWKEFPFDKLAQSPRSVATSDTVHASVVARWIGDAGYRPAALGTISGPPPWNVDATV
ncbi:MAG TPA: DUF2235 domain-containing protein [Burkholderiaceae bacterium]|nr:DUF2235 domain-containing protein [Burkholderiaceae bacterium]